MDLTGGKGGVAAEKIIERRELVLHCKWGPLQGGQPSSYWKYLETNKGYPLYVYVDSPSTNIGV